MKNFWAYVAWIVFAPFIVAGLVYAFFLLFSVLGGNTSCPPITCQ